LNEGEDNISKVRKTPQVVTKRLGGNTPKTVRTRIRQWQSQRSFKCSPFLAPALPVYAA
jgi:hypothetical protein